MSRKEAIWALGAMSGTSLDGVDAATVLTDGETVFETGRAEYRPYAPDETALLRAALGRWPGDDLGAAAEVIHRAHLDVLSRFEGADLVGFHGQTLAHEPRGRGTHQLGDGAALAEALELPVVWDFRSADVQAGGEGAPLAPFYHFACATSLGMTEPLAFLNLGGVGNITWIDPSKARPEDKGALLAFDTGPANAPLNDLMLERAGLPFDENGTLAAAGRVDETTISRFLEHDYFGKMPPKSLDRDDFPGLRDLVRDLDDADAAATVTAMTVAAVERAVQQCPEPPTRMLVCGGGRKNPVMMSTLDAALNCRVEPVDAVGLDGDMLEAQAFAYLAVRVLRGLPTSCPATTGVRTAVVGGQVSRPDRAPARRHG